MTNKSSATTSAAKIKQSNLRYHKKKGGAKWLTKSTVWGDIYSGIITQPDDSLLRSPPGAQGSSLRPAARLLPRHSLPHYTHNISSPRFMIVLKQSPRICCFVGWFMTFGDCYLNRWNHNAGYNRRNVGLSQFQFAFTVLIT